MITDKTTEAFLHKARRGLVLGGRRFGYTNVEDDKPGDIVVNEAEGRVVVRIFELRAAGYGYTRIAKMLNKEKALCPQPQQGRPAGWSPSTVRAVLHNDLYRGVLVQFKTKKRNADGEIDPRPRDESEWVRVERPDLRIVSDELWSRAHARIQHARASQYLGRKLTQPPSLPPMERLVRWGDRPSNYLLAGHARCGWCGGTLSVLTRRHGKRRVPLYGCLAYHKRGPTVCNNSLVLPCDRVDAAVLRAFTGDALEPAVISVIIDAVFAAMQPEEVAANLAELTADLREVDTKIKNLTLATEQGGAKLPSIIALLSERQKERDALLGEIGAVAAINQIHLDRPAIEQKVQAQVARWRELVAWATITDGRQLLNEMLEGPLVFTPQPEQGKVYRFVGPLVTGKVIAGIIGYPPEMASPTGPSWNQLHGFLMEVRRLQEMGISAA